MFCLEVLHKLMKEISISICKHECTYLMLGFFLSLIFRNFVTWVAFIQLQFYIFYRVMNGSVNSSAT
jgi:hypothetical protein